MQDAQGSKENKHTDPCPVMLCQAGRKMCILATQHIKCRRDKLCLPMPGREMHL